MKIDIILRSTGQVQCTVKLKSDEHCTQTLKIFRKVQKRLPNSYNRHKQSRKYCYTLDRKLQQLTGDRSLFISMYSGSQYIYSKR